MDQDWPADEMIVADEPSFPRQREPGASGKAVAPEAAKDDAAGTDWATLQALTFTANGLAG